MVHPNTKHTKDKWLSEGYRQFAELGPEKLSINNISKEVGSARASFYHYFGDIEGFIEELLARHWTIARDFDQQGKAVCTNLFPDLYHLLAKYPVPLKFSIQLFRHRSYPAYNYLFIKTYESSARTFILGLFAKQYQLNHSEDEMFDLWLTVGETWYSRLRLEDLSASTLQSHAEEIMDSVVRFTRSQLYKQF